jgi:hypothetical protein
MPLARFSLLIVDGAGRCAWMRCRAALTRARCRDTHRAQGGQLAGMKRTGAGFNRVTGPVSLQGIPVESTSRWSRSQGAALVAGLVLRA